MAASAVRAAAAAAAGAPASLSRFRGALVAAVLGDCVGGEFEGAEEVPMESVLQHLNSLDDESKGTGRGVCVCARAPFYLSMHICTYVYAYIHVCWTPVCWTVKNNLRSWAQYSVFVLVFLVSCTPLQLNADITAM